MLLELSADVMALAAGCSVQEVVDYTTCVNGYVKADPFFGTVTGMTIDDTTEPGWTILDAVLSARPTSYGDDGLSSFRLRLKAKVASGRGARRRPVEHQVEIVHMVIAAFHAQHGLTNAVDLRAHLLTSEGGGHIASAPPGFPTRWVKGLERSALMMMLLHVAYPGE